MTDEVDETLKTMFGVDPAKCHVGLGAECGKSPQKVRTNAAPADLADHDRAALQAALSQILDGPDRGRASQIEAMLTDTSWFEVARFASYILQGDVLGLKPWESPPCHIGDPDELGADHRDHAGAKLLRKMLAAGVSRYAPDPIGAIALAKAVKKAAAR
jgi:hypothetical protein